MVLPFVERLGQRSFARFFSYEPEGGKPMPLLYRPFRERHWRLVGFLVLPFLTGAIVFAWQPFSSLLFAEGAFLNACSVEEIAFWEATAAAGDRSAAYMPACDAQDRRVQALYSLNLATELVCGSAAGVALDLLGPLLTALAGAAGMLVGLACLMHAAAARIDSLYVVACAALGAAANFVVFPVIVAADYFPGREGLILSSVVAVQNLSSLAVALLETVYRSRPSLSLQRLFGVYTGALVVPAIAAFVLSVPLVRKGTPAAGAEAAGAAGAPEAAAGAGAAAAAEETAAAGSPRKLHPGDASLPCSFTVELAGPGEGAGDAPRCGEASVGTAVPWPAEVGKTGKGKAAAAAAGPTAAADGGGASAPPSTATVTTSAGDDVADERAAAARPAAGSELRSRGPAAAPEPGPAAAGAENVARGAGAPARLPLSPKLPSPGLAREILSLETLALSLYSVLSMVIYSYYMVVMRKISGPGVAAFNGYAQCTVALWGLVYGALVDRLGTVFLAECTAAIGFAVYACALAPSVVPWHYIATYLFVIGSGFVYTIKFTYLQEFFSVAHQGQLMALQCLFSGVALVANMGLRGAPVDERAVLGALTGAAVLCFPLTCLMRARKRRTRRLLARAEAEAAAVA